MSTMLSGSTSAFDIALEGGDAYYDMRTGNFYRFDEYRTMKLFGMKPAGVYLSDDQNFITGLWEEKDVQKYIKDNNLTLKY